MNRIDSVIENYLKSKNTNSALMITGEWGCGKTHYYLKNIEERIRIQGFEPIYISLNGIKNQEQLRKAILTKSLLGTSDNKRLSNFNKALQGIKEKFVKVAKRSDIGNTFFSLFNVHDFIEFESVLFCFDDLERISKEFPIEDVLGFINSEFVEHRRNKVIIIGDESKKQLVKEEYAKSKEKVIGWTIEFQANLDLILDSLFEIFLSKKEFHKRLLANKEFTLRLINDFECRNIRTIIFFLDCLNSIFENYPTKSLNIEKEVIYSTLVFANEYKRGSLNKFLSKKSIPSFFKPSFSSMYLDGIFSSDDSHEEDSGEIENYETYFEKYKNNKYTIFTEHNLEYIFFESIYHFITNGYLDKKRLLEEIGIYSSSKINKNNPQELDCITKLIHFNSPCRFSE